MGFFNNNTLDRKWWEIILWWELRRLLYNAIMLCIGFLSLALCSISIPIVYLAIGAFLNVLYTLGWVIELVYIRNQRCEIRKTTYPKHAFLAYLIFSIIIVFGLAFYFLLV